MSRVDSITSLIDLENTALVTESCKVTYSGGVRSFNGQGLNGAITGDEAEN